MVATVFSVTDGGGKGVLPPIASTESERVSDVKRGQVEQVHVRSG